MAMPENRSIGELFSDLSRDIGTLVRKELELLKSEMTSKVTTAGGHLGIAVAGGALVHAGLLVLLAAIVLALSRLGLSPWLAALLVAAVTMLVGFLLVTRGLKGLQQTSLAPTHAIDALKENPKWTSRTPA
jgi:Putative Actinobacterial Holin-X, holin superfamily III